jgi:hypothetical protein
MDELNHEGEVRPTVVENEEEQHQDNHFIYW